MIKQSIPNYIKPKAITIAGIKLLKKWIKILTSRRLVLKYAIDKTNPISAYMKKLIISVGPCTKPNEIELSAIPKIGQSFKK